MVRTLKIATWITIVALICLFVIVFGGNDISISPYAKKQLLSNIRADFDEEIVSDFQFVNQFNDVVNQDTFHNKIYIADFFFTSCPTICPMMGGNKVKIQNSFISNEDVLLLSHSIDTKTDSVPRLLEYATSMGAVKNKWHLVTGNKEEIYKIAKEYYVTAQESDVASGAYVHDGSFILIDKKRKIRGIYNGTNSSDTELLIADVTQLLKE